VELNKLIWFTLLYWLPTEWRIKLKIACITYKTISTTQCAYLYSLLKHYTPSHTLRSSHSIVCSPCPHMFWFSELHCCRSHYLELCSSGYSQ